MVARWYRPDAVEAARARRAAADVRAPRPDAEATAKAIAARVLEGYATGAPFFAGVSASGTGMVREALRAIAKTLASP